MNDASLDQNQLTTFELRVAGRHFPNSPNREIQPEEELNIDFRALLDRLVDLFRGSAKMDEKFESVTTFSDLIPIYQSGVTSIGKFQTDWFQFVRSLIHFEVDESVSQAASAILQITRQRKTQLDKADVG